MKKKNCKFSQTTHVEKVKKKKRAILTSSVGVAINIGPRTINPQR